ncbi:hypothetical protein [Vibrio sp. D431a]|uniref:hypothetical protein n=1 Tax=Vibrio sp. D431a TaxID=2837388 RepID=UPI0025557A69|nr:hypothetical protein [Vibrio sp. D431a]MDK9790068.1 hypothetical protein [Vibrio sp. D431a]
MINCIEYANKRESEFLSTLKSNVEEGTHEYEIGKQIWKNVTGKGNAFFFLCNDMNYRKANKVVTESYGKSNPELLKPFNELDLKGITESFVEVGFAIYGVEFTPDLHDDMEETFFYSKQEGSEDEEDFYNIYNGELIKSESALKTICEKYDLDYHRILSNRFSVPHGKPFEFVIETDEDGNEVRDICNAEYQSSRGDVPHPHTGKEGFDPLYHVHRIVRGVGDIGFFDVRNMNVSDGALRDSLLDIAKERPDLMAEARKRALKKEIEELEAR